MTGNNPKLDLDNVHDHAKFGQILSIHSEDNVLVHTKYGQILSIHSQDIERIPNSDVNQGPLLHQNFEKNEGQQSQARSCQC